MTRRRSGRVRRSAGRGATPRARRDTARYSTTPNGTTRRHRTARHDAARYGAIPRGTKGPTRPPPAPDHVGQHAMDNLPGELLDTRDAAEHRQLRLSGSRQTVALQ